MPGKITIFQDILNTSTPWYITVADALDRIKSGKSRVLVEAIRNEKDSATRNDIKKQLPAVCFSGEFSKRADNAIINHSGVICLDFDKFPSVALMNGYRKAIQQDPFVYSVFTSPSGNGLKVLVKIPMIVDQHKLYFNALEEYFACEEFDTTCKNISRVCYESYDPKLFINDESVEWTKMVEEKYTEVVKVDKAPMIIVTEEDQIIAHLLKWWDKAHGMVDGKKNTNLFTLASAMNQYGIPKSTCSYALREFDQGKEKIRQEIEAVVRSAYKHVADHNTRAFEDADKLHSLERKIKRGEAKSDIEAEIIDQYGFDKKQAKAIVEKIDQKAQEDIQVFWKKTSKGVVSIQHDRFTEFLQDNGFHKFYPEGSKNFIFVRKVSNRVKNTTEQTIKDFVLGYIRKRVDDPAVWNYFADKVRYFKEDFLSMLEAIEIQFMEDTRETSYLFFKNVAVLVEKDNISTVEYDSLPGWIWEDQMIDREYSECDGSKCEFRKFIHNVSGDEAKRIESVESTIGFLLHGYKPSSKCPAVILNDETISENPEGGTGKGIFSTALSYMRKMVKIDGKLFSFDKGFPYQTVQQDTQLIAFDDVQKNWKFENTFPLITEGMTLEKKNKDAVFIDFSRSPKILITTNYAIRGSGNSFDRRKWELEFKQFYRKDHTPREEFGHDLFTDWNDSEWCIYDNYMIGCLQLYLEKNLVESPFTNLRARQFIAKTNHDFYEFMMDATTGYRATDTEFLVQSVLDEFVSLYPDYAPRSKRTLGNGFFTQYLAAWGEFEFGGESEKGRGANGIWVKFKKGKKKKTQEELY